MRKVIVYKWINAKKVNTGEGYFHQWGIGLTECSIAIIERFDGTVENIPSDNIEFIDIID